MVLESVLFEVVKFLLGWLSKTFDLENRLPGLFSRLKGVERSLWADASRKRLNTLFTDETVIHGPYQHSPVIQGSGVITLPPDAQANVDKWLAHLRERDAPNDPHGILCAPVAWMDDPVRFTFQRADYAQLRALREAAAAQSGTPPQVLSANALIVCPEDRVVMLHRRSPASATYPNCLHTVGGAYWPPGTEGRSGDGNSLRRTVLREVLEETHANIALDKATPMVIMEEVRTGFVQVAYLGCVISAAMRQDIEENAEGHVVWIGYDDLERRLREDTTWVPTGKAGVLAWLAMAAPGAGHRPRFGKLSPTQLFKRLTDEPKAPAQASAA